MIDKSRYYNRQLPHRFYGQTPRGKPFSQEMKWIQSVLDPDEFLKTSAAIERSIFSDFGFIPALIVAGVGTLSVVGYMWYNRMKDAKSEDEFNFYRQQMSNAYLNGELTREEYDALMGVEKEPSLNLALGIGLVSLGFILFGMAGILKK